MKMKSALAVALALATSLPMTTASAQGPMSSLKQSAPSSDVVQVRRGAAIGLGIAAAVGTAIILSEAARADGHRRYRRSSYCGDLLYRWGNPAVYRSGTKAEQYSCSALLALGMGVSTAKTRAITRSALASIAARFSS